METIEHITAVEELAKKYQTADKMGANSNVFAYSGGYSNYKTTEIISNELLRNLGLGLLCVFICTFFLIFELFTSLLVCASVVMTLLNVTGYMYFWDLTIDTATAIFVTIAMGLAVDYSAHIAHAFLVESGDRNKRVRITLEEIGPAVLNGGFSTFLAFVLLVSSQSFVFQTFFKVFFLIVIFGLYHGLVFLPVVLSFIGPKSHAVEPHDDDEKHDVSVVRVSSAEPVKGVDKQGNLHM